MVKGYFNSRQTHHELLFDHLGGVRQKAVGGGGAVVDRCVFASIELVQAAVYRHKANEVVVYLYACPFVLQSQKSTSSHTERGSR